jgi:hypothetical protein
MVGADCRDPALLRPAFFGAVFFFLAVFAGFLVAAFLRFLTFAFFPEKIFAMAFSSAETRAANPFAIASPQLDCLRGPFGEQHF